MHDQRGRYFPPGEFYLCPETRAPRGGGGGGRGEDNSGGEVPEEPSAKRKCKRSLVGDVVNKEIPEYYRGRRVGPGVLP